MGKISQPYAVDIYRCHSVRKFRVCFRRQKRKEREGEKRKRRKLARSLEGVCIPSFALSWHSMVVIHVFISLGVPFSGPPSKRKCIQGGTVSQYKVAIELGFEHLMADHVSMRDEEGLSISCWSPAINVSYRIAGHFRVVNFLYFSRISLGPQKITPPRINIHNNIHVTMASAKTLLCENPF